MHIVHPSWNSLRTEVPSNVLDLLGGHLGHRRWVACLLFVLDHRSPVIQYRTCLNRQPCSSVMDSQEHKLKSRWHFSVSNTFWFWEFSRTQVSIHRRRFQQRNPIFLSHTRPLLRCFTSIAISWSAVVCTCENKNGHNPFTEVHWFVCVRASIRYVLETVSLPAAQDRLLLLF